MALKEFSIGLLVILACTATWIVAASAQSTSDCSSALVSLSPCLNYITGNDTTPLSSCCTQLANVVHSEPKCLCMVLNSSGGSLAGMSINQTQALALPAACKLQTPPASQCNANGGGNASPATPSSGGGTMAVPTDGTSDGSVPQIPVSLVFTLLFVATSLSKVQFF